jgi:5-formyltetrahydrofolate cyclo-ligase
MEEAMSKRELRASMKAQRRKVSQDERRIYSIALCDKLLNRVDVRKFIEEKATFALYIASSDEIDLSSMAESLWSVGCKVVVPAWRGDTYKLVAYSKDTKLVAGPMGILEPEAKDDGLNAVSEDNVAVWIVPGLAFSKSGARLGYGGGWYDRFLSKTSSSAITLGVAYPFQIVAHLPLEPHDLPLTDIEVV